MLFFFFFSSRRRHTRYWRDWSSDVCSSDLAGLLVDVTGVTGAVEPAGGGTTPHVGDATQAGGFPQYLRAEGGGAPGAGVMVQPAAAGEVVQRVPGPLGHRAGAGQLDLALEHRNRRTGGGAVPVGSRNVQGSLYVAHGRTGVAVAE